jgi:hypothetical protein
MVQSQTAVGISRHKLAIAASKNAPTDVGGYKQRSSQGGGKPARNVFSIGLGMRY